MAQTFDLVVNRTVLFDEGIGMRNVGLGLVVIVIAHEILHRIFREKLLKLAAQLCGERFVVRQDKRWPIEPRNDIRHGEGLARSGHAEKHLLVQSCLQTLYKALDRLRLISGRLKGGRQLE